MGKKRVDASFQIPVSAISAEDVLLKINVAMQNLFQQLHLRGKKRPFYLGVATLTVCHQLCCRPSMGMINAFNSWFLCSLESCILIYDLIMVGVIM